MDSKTTCFILIRPKLTGLAAQGASGLKDVSKYLVLTLLFCFQIKEYIHRIKLPLRNSISQCAVQAVSHLKKSFQPDTFLWLDEGNDDWFYTSLLSLDGLYVNALTSAWFCFFPFFSLPGSHKRCRYPGHPVHIIPFGREIHRQPFTIMPLNYLVVRFFLQSNDNLACTFFCPMCALIFN